MGLPFFFFLHGRTWVFLAPKISTYGAYDGFDLAGRRGGGPNARRHWPSRRAAAPLPLQTPFPLLPLPSKREESRERSTLGADRQTDRDPNPQETNHRTED